MDIRELVAKEARGEYEPAIALTFIKRWESASRPALLSCDDGESYVVKGSQNQKMLYNEYVCARLGHLLGANATWVRFVQIGAELRNGDLANFGPGLALGSLRVPLLTERAGVQFVDVPQNRAAFASLQILYSWCVAGDHQLLYETKPPQIVWSSDHGHFFPGGPNWTSASLEAHKPIVLDAFFSACLLTDTDRTPFLNRARSIDDSVISELTKAPPADWGVDTSERAALARFLIGRRDRLIELVQGAR